MKPHIQVLDNVGTGLIIEWASGIIISSQTGGTACLHPKIEGVFIPFGNDYAAESRSFLSLELALFEYFDGLKYRGTGATGGLDVEDAHVINTFLKKNRLFEWFEVDDEKLKSSHEAWVHVRIKGDYELANGFGPYPRSGVLTWTNGD